MSRWRERLDYARTRVSEVSPEEAYRLQQDGAIILDVREADELAQGSPLGSLRISRGLLEPSIEARVPDTAQSILVLCAAGERSLLAAETLQQMGYRDVASVRGGFAAWRSSGLDHEVAHTLDSQRRDRYRRHLMLPEIGDSGQLRLLESRVLLVGAGGLGAPAALYLAAAGVGRMALVDDDRIERSNLQRQVLYRESDVGRSKVEVAQEALRALNPDVEVTGIASRICAENVDRILGGYDVVLDGTDNFAARYLVNDACVRLGIPNVQASVFRFEGQLTVFDPGGGAPCYRCLYPEPPPDCLSPSCAEAGVLGTLTGVVGTLQAMEAVKVLLGIGDGLRGWLLTYDGLAARFRTLKVRRDPGCAVCGEAAEA